MTQNNPDNEPGEALSEKEVKRLGSQIAGDVLAQMGVRGTLEERQGADTIAAAWVSKIVERVTEELNYRRSRASLAAASSPLPAESAQPQSNASLTDEQITRQVADMQARLSQCSSTGTAYRVKWHDVKAIIATIQTLQERLAQANDFNNDIVEREAACCPEDVPFDEYIRTLQRKLETRPRAGYPWTGNEP